MVVFALMGAACSTATIEASVVTVDELAVDATSSSTALAHSVTSVPVTPATSVSTTTVAETAISDVQPPPECRHITALDTSDGSDDWQVVNDGVMGGRSEGLISFADDRLVFEGAINTNGGGFSSIRLPVVVGTLAGATSILLQAAFDDRSYLLTLEDQVDGRDRRVSHQAPIEAAASSTEGRSAPSRDIATIPIDSFVPSIFGQLIDDEPIQAALVDEIGVMISDGIDGPFRLEIDWIAACP